MPPQPTCHCRSMVRATQANMNVFLQDSAVDNMARWRLWCALYSSRRKEHTAWQSGSSRGSRSTTRGCEKHASQRAGMLHHGYIHTQLVVAFSRSQMPSSFCAFIAVRRNELGASSNVGTRLRGAGVEYHNPPPPSEPTATEAAPACESRGGRSTWQGTVLTKQCSFADSLSAPRVCRCAATHQLLWHET
jgi:hypothetical protein